MTSQLLLFAMFVICDRCTLRSRSGFICSKLVCHMLFNYTPNTKHANNRLSCAGICELSKDPSTGKLTRIRLKLSTPLLQYRPRSDTINTLLHEAIHAYFFITTSWQHSRGDDGTGHGVGFQLLADAINNHGNYDITIYHTFHDEVESFRTHVWKCNGPCSNMPPFFGLVKRSMNRAPGKSDTWWAKHQAECGGTYTKIKEPAPTKKQVEAMSAKERAGRQKNKLDKWIIPGTKQSEQEKSIGDLAEIQGGKSLPSAVQKKRKAQATEIQNPAKNEQPQQKKSRAENTDDVFFIEETTMVDCPICEARLVETLINQHLDAVHPASD